MISGYFAIKGINEDTHGLDHLNLNWSGAYYEHGITYRYVTLEGLEAMRAHMVAIQNPVVDPQSVILLEFDGGNVAMGGAQTTPLDKDEGDMAKQKHPTKNPMGKPGKSQSKGKKVLIDEE